MGKPGPRAPGTHEDRQQPEVCAPLVPGASGPLGAPWGNEDPDVPLRGGVMRDRVYPSPRPKAGTETSLCVQLSLSSALFNLEPYFPESMLSGDLEEKEG